jgi:hypothetical protein
MAATIIILSLLAASVLILGALALFGAFIEKITR